jgi:hypothetical protein
MSENEHPRKCENWLTDFLKWTIPRSEAKESYIFWSGLFTLSCVLRRHVKVGKDFLGSWECYPYLYLLFLGPPGNKKTTTTSYNLELLDEIPGLISAPDQITVPKLASVLAEAEECAMYIVAGELSEFIIKSGPDMYSFLTRAFDGAKKLSVGTHIRNIELAENPCINFLGASTLETLSVILPQAALDGGFGRRCIFIYEETTRRRKLSYTDVNVLAINNEHKPNLVHDLKYIANNLFGNFTFTNEADKKFDQWYQDGAGYKKGRLDRLKGYYETKPAFVMKVAMLLKIADRDIIHKDQLILTWKNIEEAIQLLEGTETNMQKVVGGMGKNVYKSDIRSIYSYIQENQPISLSHILQEFEAVAEHGKLMELIKGLASANLITIEPKGTDFELKVK